MSKILVIGDSHAKIYFNPFFRYLSKCFLKDSTFIPCFVRGATISGINNPNSETNAGASFRKALKENRDCQICMIQLGEVDTGFVLWLKSEKYGVDIDDLLKMTIEKMQGLITEVIDFGYIPIVVSAPLPTIKDNCVWGEVANLRKEIKASQLRRTRLAMEFNNEISRYCNSAGVLNINLDSVSVGKNGLVKVIFLHYRKSDHHYNPIIYSIVLIRRLRKILPLSLYREDSTG